MRKIDQQIASAIKNGKSFCGGNTAVRFTGGEVEYSGENMDVMLYGHRIAWERDGVLTLNNCGYHTNVTKSRMNTVLSGLSLPYQIRTKNRHHQIDGHDFRVAKIDVETRILICFEA